MQSDILKLDTEINIFMAIILMSFIFGTSILRIKSMYSLKAMPHNLASEMVKLILCFILTGSTRI